MQALALTRLRCVLETYNTLGERHISLDVFDRRKSRDWLDGDPEALIPINEHLLILEAAADAAGSPLFGLEVGKNSHLADHGVFGLRVLQSMTLFHALTTFCRLMPWYASSAHFWLAESAGKVWFCRGRQTGTERQLKLQEQRIVMRMINVVRSCAGPHWKPEALLLCARPEPRLEEAEALTDVKICYQQSCTAVAVPRLLLGLPVFQSSTQARRIPGQIESALRATAPAHDFAGSVEQVVQALLPMNDASIEQVAEMARCSVRSLQRQLAKEGLRYSDLVDRARFRLATRRLAAGEGSMIDISFDLGYANQAHFSRAFRRWAGMSPREFRRRHTTLPCQMSPRLRARPGLASYASTSDLGRVRIKYS